MDATRYDSLLKQRLNDPNGATYSGAVRAAALTAAVYAYSAYFPALRRLGTGALLAGANATQNQVTTNGGPFQVGDAIAIDQAGQTAETFTVLAATTSTPADGPVGATQTLTLSGNLQNAHALGAPVGKTALGIALAAGQDTYLLPRDFIGIEQETFDLVITGRRTSIRKTDVFYDAVYSASARLGQTNSGSNQNYGSGLTAGAGAFGSPGNQVFTVARQGSGETLYRFVKSDNPQLIIVPAPQQTRFLDPVFYYAQQSVASIPDSEMEDLLVYGMWACLVGESAMWIGKPVYSQADIKREPDANVKAAMQLVSGLIARWDLRTRQRPYAVGG